MRKQDHQDHQEDEAAFISESDGSDEEEAMRHFRYEALDRTPTGLPMQEEPPRRVLTLKHQVKL